MKLYPRTITPHASHFERAHALGDLPFASIAHGTALNHFGCVLTITVHTPGEEAFYLDPHPHAGQKTSG